MVLYPIVLLYKRFFEYHLYQVHTRGNTTSNMYQAFTFLAHLKRKRPCMHDGDDAPYGRISFPRGK